MTSSSAPHQALGFIPFLLRHGVMTVGLPLAFVLDVARLLWYHDLPLFISAEHAVQLLVLTWAVGVPAGLLAGRIRWRLAERRALEEALTREFDMPEPDRIAG